MAKVYADDGTSLQVEHEVRQVSITNTKNIMANAELSMRRCKLTAQPVVSLTAGTHASINSSRT